MHISAVEKAGYTNLAEEARVSYEMKAGRSGKMSAERFEPMALLGRHCGERCDKSLSDVTA